MEEGSVVLLRWRKVEREQGFGTGETPVDKEMRYRLGTSSELTRTYLIQPICVFNTRLLADGLHVKT